MRQRLALLVAAAMTLVLAAFLIPLALLVRTVAADRALSRATTEAQALVPVVATADRQALTLAIEETAARSGRTLTVFLPDGTVLGAPVARTPGVELASRGSSVTVSGDGGREILIAVGTSQGNAVIRTVVGAGEMTRGVQRAWLILALLGLVLLGLGIAVADRLARSIVQPVAALAGVSHRLAAGDTDARAGFGGPPEVRAVAAALNHLAARIQDLLRAEREAVADLSHRLRTPLTALRLEADALADPAEAARVGGHVATLDRAVTSVIEEARRRGSGPGECDAAEVVAERVAFWTVLAEDQGRTFDTDLAPGPLPVGVTGTDLAACVDALLGNVFSHTPDGVGFAVRLAARPGGGAVLTVADRGPGFAGADPFRRGASGAGSSGLGLDIVRQTAVSSGGTTRAGTDGGAVVTVELGPPEGLSQR